MRNTRTPTEVVGAIEERVRAHAPIGVAFILAITGGLVSRYDRLRKERDHGAVSIEAAIIIAVLIAAAVAIAGVIIVLWKKYQTDLDKSDDNYKDPNAP